MNKYIVTTTINKPTLALKKYSKMKDWKLIVVLDKKTPKFSLNNAIILTCKDQEKISKKLSNLIGWNCIQRRNFGFLKALEFGAEIVATIDDDNIPLSNWGGDLSLLLKKKSIKKYFCKDYFDPIFVTNHANLWHRGFPIQLINKRKILKVEKRKEIFDIKADFWNGDPDIDSICRMQFAPECNFNQRYFPFYSNKISPFNSQNTFLKAKILKDYFLFPNIGRMDDIWGSYYLQSLGYKVCYDGPSVYQKRNPHNLTHDFNNEIIGYQNSLDLLYEIQKSPDNISKFVPYKSMKAYDLYRKLIDLKK